MPRPVGKPNRPFPVHTLTEALKVAQTIRDQNAGKPMNRLLLADAMKLSPSGSPFRQILSSSLKYGLTKGTEKAAEITPTETGLQATSMDDPIARQAALRRAARTPSVFERFYKQFDQAKLPSDDLFPKTLTQQFGVPEVWAKEAAEMIEVNGRLAGLIRDITGGPRVMLDAGPTPVAPEHEGEEESEEGEEHKAKEGGQEGPTEVETQPESAVEVPTTPPIPPADDGKPRSKPIFVGHGKNKKPLEGLERILNQLGVAYKVAVHEPNLGRPIPQKVRDVMKECGSAILIFTKDQQFKDPHGNEVWRPSENVIYELGAASFEYENRVVILMEEGLTFPTNFDSIGRIEFPPTAIEQKMPEILRELIAFGLVRIVGSG